MRHRFNIFESRRWFFRIGRLTGSTTVRPNDGTTPACPTKPGEFRTTGAKSENAVLAENAGIGLKAYTQYLHHFSCIDPPTCSF